MLKVKMAWTAVALSLAAQGAVAGSTNLGVGQLSVVNAPLDVSGMAAMAAVSLIIGVQLIKRRK